jgi:hypothetical protein
MANLKKTIRQRSALARLEKQFVEFKAAHKDKKPWDSTRNGRTIHHAGRKYAAECERIQQEIANLKANMKKTA